MISVLSQLTKTLLPWLPELVSIYIKAVPIGGREAAPESPVGEDVLVDLTILFNLPFPLILE